jgi:hypothetical protein
MFLKIEYLTLANIRRKNHLKREGVKENRINKENL